MDLKEIQNLIKFVSKSGVSEVSMEQGDFKITIKTDNPVEQVMVQAPVNMVQAQPQQPIVQPPVTTPEASENKVTSDDSTDDSKFVTIKSPMIGTFYRRPSPDKDVFVNVGDSISSGDVLCVIEAMKLFNEIESEISGKIVKILVDDQTPVEYDQPLFLVDPS
ncbi:MAG TPA: acetyl-CoA carboxylase biotin carboxyl carrier protein [Crocinitomix sp.]|nr:acetyl-CoA carboxylase biotin carboxyl carrier protein [Crocinitomix sp.]